MKKLFLIPLMAMLCTVMAWGEIRTAGTFAEMQSAISEAAAGDVIQLTADFTATSTLTIGKSISIDGQNHKITGAVKDNGIFKLQGTSDNQLLVAIENVKIDNAPTSGQNVILYLNGYIDSLAIDHCELICSKNSGNPKPIEYRGTQLQAAKIGIHNSHLYGNTSGYAYRAYNPAILYIDNSQIEGYGCLNFQYPRNAGELGARGTQVYAKNCNFDSPNVHSGGWNSFMAFNFADDGISMELDNCGMNAEVLGNQGQAIFGTNGWNLISRRTQDINIVIKGDNSYINGTFMDPGFIVDYNGDYDDVWENGFWSTYPSDAWFDAHPEANDFNYIYHEDYNLATGYDPSLNFTSQNTADITLTITGGTYSVNPNEYKFKMHVATEDPTTHMPLTWTQKGITIPDGYEVKEITTIQGKDTTTLYRVRQEITGSTALNDNSGQNPSEDIKVESSVTLANEETVAEYVEVAGGSSTDPKVTVTVPTGKTFEVTNGLDVSGNAEVVVEAGSTVVVGEGGIIAEKPENIVISADENGSASLLLDPKVIVNTTPNLTVKMKAKDIGWINGAGGKEYFWHRFALPIQEASSWVKNPNKSTYVFGWNYSANDWEQLSALTQMKPFKGYTLSADFEGLGDVEYTFTGQLAGNTNNDLQFSRNGFNFFGNSYTGYIDILALVDQIMGDNKIDGTVWVWGDDQQYHAVPLMTLREGGNVYATEIAPMQTFIMKQNGGVNASTELNYASAVWGNPRYGNSSPAPRRVVANETTRMRIVVTAENGKSDFVMFSEEDRFSDAFEKGYDSEKYMNEKALNMYATVNDVDYSVIATDNLAGKALTIQTVASVNYTMSFAKVNGETYAIRDLMTNIVTPMTEGNTYTFAAQPNTTIEGRFVIVPMQNMPTDVETVETTTAAKGIYTVMGQYVGEDFDILPAGMYIVNGVKIVK